MTGLVSGLKSPLLWAPILGIAIVIAGISLPRVISASLQLIGVATSGIAVFAVSLILASHPYLGLASVFVHGTGAPMKVQQELMRHASIQTTMNVYGQAMPESKRAANGKVVTMVLKPLRASA